MTKVSKTPNKRVYLALVIGIISALTGYLKLLPSDEKIPLKNNQDPAKLNLAKQLTPSLSEHVDPQGKSNPLATLRSPAPEASNLSLKLLGVVLSSDSKQSSATIESKSTVTTYYLHEQITSADVVLTNILFDRVLLRNAANDEVVLRLDNSVPADKGDEFSDHTIDAPTALTPAEQKALVKSIGNRPSVLEHIVQVIPLGANGGGEGFTVTPGLNPSLFRSAGFKEGDILQEINAFDLSLPEDYALAIAAIGNAATLEFTVVRGGRRVRLYLDIPSKGLSMGD